MSTPADIAIVGMACIFPKAPDLRVFWRNITDGVDAITDAPPGRIDPRYFDASSAAPDRFYTRRGGFIDELAQVDPLRHGIMPVAARGAEPDQLLALEVATAALTDAGYAGPGARPLDKERAAVILGRGNYLGAGTVRLEQHVRTADQLLIALERLVPGLSASELQRVKADFQSRLGAYGPDTAIGLVPNLTASRIANRLDLRGPAFTVDGACASSLLALDQAVTGLMSGRLDVALVGGVHLTHDPSFWSVFCQLGALSRTGSIRPLSAHADGILIGEGLGVVVLRRTQDARRAGDHIYARIRGTGTASDGRVASLMTPDVAGQLRALRDAWSMSGLDPQAAALIEAHGTGTTAGDGAELETIARFFGPAGAARGVIGSVKSMIGHAMPAAGMAGLIKAAMAVHDGLFPPTLHAEDPNPALKGGRFQPIGKAEPWDAPHRIAGVNAFGFGGINAHVVLQNESPRRSARKRPAVLPIGGDERIGLFAADTAAALADRVRAGELGGVGGVRLALVDPSPERRAKAADAVLTGQPRRGRDGMFFEPVGLLTDGGKLAFVFPGVEAVFEPRLDDLGAWLGRPFKRPEVGSALERQGVSVIEAGRLLDLALRSCGARPDVIAGHSIGEWSGMIASGVLPEDGIDDFLAALVPDSHEAPGVLFLAAGTNLDKARALAEGLDVVVSHDNCPHQVILCGPDAAIATLAERFKAAKVLAQVLPFKSGYHAPYFGPYVGVHQRYLAELDVQPGELPLWSATIAAPYPSDPRDIRALAVRHLVEPVRFREVITRLWESGVRVFVQVGTGSLAAFIDDSLRGKPFLALQSNVKERTGLAQLRRVLAALWVNGADVAVDLPAIPSTSKTLLHLELGVPFVTPGVTLSVGAVPVTAAPVAPAPLPATPVGARVQDLLSRIDAASRAVAKAFDAAPAQPATRPAAPAAVTPSVAAPAAPAAPLGSAPTAPLRTSATTLRLSAEQQPYLLDHSLFPQPPSWPSIADRYPVVPMTMHVRLMEEAATALFPSHVAIRVEQIRARTWLALDPPVDLVIRSAQLDAVVPGEVRVRVDLEGYSEGVVVLATAYPAAPAPSHGPLAAPRASAVDERALYEDKWLFHGPAYRAVTALGALGTNGIDGVLAALPAKGALLDGAGQLFGFYVGQVSARNRLVLPIRIERIEWFAPEPPADRPVPCTVRIGRMGAQTVRGDLELVLDGRLLCRITGWEDWRFETDERLWEVMRRPGHVFYSDPVEGFATPGEALHVLHGGSWGKATHDYLVRRYLSEAERLARDALSAPRRSPWLLGRIAAKDAVRTLLLAEGGARRYPVEVTVLADDVGRPVVTVPGEVGLFVSISHVMTGETGVAVALASRAPVGVDVEAIAPRSDRFVALGFSEGDLAWLPAGLDDDGRAEWLTRLWCAKEAVSKALGTGLLGQPRSFAIDAVDGQRVRVRGRWTSTLRREQHIIAWTELSEPTSSDAPSPVSPAPTGGH